MFRVYRMYSYTPVKMILGTDGGVGMRRGMGDRTSVRFDERNYICSVQEGRIVNEEPKTTKETNLLWNEEDRMNPVKPFEVYLWSRRVLRREPGRHTNGNMIGNRMEPVRKGTG